MEEERGRTELEEKEKGRWKGEKEGVKRIGKDRREQSNEVKYTVQARERGKGC